MRNTENTVSLTRKNYKVKLEEENDVIYIKKELVEYIANKANEKPEQIAILLAYIDFSAKDTSIKRVKKIDETKLEDGLEILLSRFYIDELITIIRNLRYHEIQELFNDPFMDLEKII